MSSILTTSEIAFILQKANDPIYKIPGVVCFFSKNNPLEIIKVSPKGLIFIEGNDETGFKHISERHNYYSDRIDWIDFKDNNSNANRKKQAHMGNQ